MSNYFNLQNNPVISTPSTLTVPKIDTIGYPGDDTAADPAGGQTITLTGSGFQAGASVLINTTAVGVVSVVNSTTITFTSPANSAGSYVLYVVNTDGGTAIAVPGIQYSGVPTWTTAAGSLGSYTETVAIANTVTATGDAPITYSVFSGTLPTGATLNSANGYISGTSPLAASPTTYTFTIRATDAEQQDTNRQFSLTINPDVVTWSSPANGTTYTSVVNSAISNVALSASAASGQGIVFSANALPTGLSISGSNITGTPTVVANSSTLLTATANTTNATATRTINWVISVASDTYFPYVTSLLSASTPTSTFVADASTNSFNVTVFGDTRPSNFGPYTPGYYSNFFNGSTDYLSVPDNAALSLGSGNFTIECFFYIAGNSASNPSSERSGQLITKFQNTSNYYTLYVLGNSTTTGTALRLEIVVGGAATTIQYIGTIAQNQWHHFAAVRNGSGSNNVTLYLNGSSVATGTNTATDSNTGPVYIGYYGYPSYPNYFNGYISNARIVKGAAVYTSNFTPSTTPLTAIANTSLLTCQSNRFIDNSTNNFAITRNGDTLISGFDPFVPSSSFAGYGSGYFDGTGDYLSIPSTTALQFGTGDFTVEAWVYLTATPGAQYAQIIGRTEYGTNADWMFQITNSRTLTWYMQGSFVATSTGTIPLNTWTNVAATRSGSSIRLFINGVIDGTATNSGSTELTGSGDYTIGADQAGDEVNLTGYISNLRVLKGAAAYTTNFTPSTTPLTAIANTSLLTLQNNQPNNNSMFLDASTNNFNITRNGNTTQGSFSPYGGGWSNFFNGSTDYFSMSDNNAFQYGSGDFALECWVYPTATLSGNYIVSQWYSGDKGIILGIIGGSLAFYYSTTGSNDITLVSATNPPLNQWSHLLACRTGNTISLYLNGTRVATTTESGTLYNSTSSIGIATHVQGFGTSLWPGYISNLRSIAGSNPYNAAQTTITVPTAPLTAVANTRLLICADNRFIDDGPSNFTLTRAGTPSVQRFNPFNPVLTTPTSYSGYFDGNGDYLSIASNAALSWGTGDYTVEAWVYLTSAQSRIMVVSGVGNFAFFTNSSANIIVGRVGTDELTSTGTVTLNQWVHIAATRSSNTTRIFINGTLSSTPTSITTNYGQNLTYIGSDATIMTTGYISNFRAVKGTALYTSNFTPSTTPLTAVANTSLLTLQSPTFIDNSTNNFTITNNGDTAPRQFNPFGWTSTTGSSAAYTPALYGGSAYFDGTGDWLTAPDSTAFDVPGDYTVELWFYPAVSGGLQRLFMIGDYRSTFNGLDLYVNGSNQLVFYSNGASIITGGSVVNFQWNHVALVRRGSSTNNTTLYLNGISVGQATNTTSFTGVAANGVSIGLEYSGAATSVTSATYISDARLSNGTARYTSNFQPPIAPLTALQNTVLLNNMTGAGIYDSSMMANYETVGNASISTSLKKYGNTSMSFDGSGDLLFSPYGPNYNLGSGDFTIEGWVYFNTLPSNNYVLFASYGNSTSTQRWIFGYDTRTVTSSPGIFFTVLNASNSAIVNVPGAGTSGWTTGTWYHVAITRNGNSWRLFRDGVQNGSTVTDSDAIPDATANGLCIGTEPDKSSAAFNGYIDDFRITRGIARYTTTFTPPTTPFITN